MTNRFYKYIFICLFFAFGFLFCKSTSEVYEWKNNSYTGGPFNKIVVIGIFKNLVNRKHYENAMSAELKKNGIDSVASLDIMPVYKRYQHEEMEKIFDSLKIDGILIVRVKSWVVKDKYHPPAEISIPTDTNKAYINNYNRYYNVTEVPAYVSSTSVFNMECSLYTNENNRLVWTAEAETIDKEYSGEEPYYSSRDSTDLAKLTVSSLRKNSLIK